MFSRSLASLLSLSTLTLVLAIHQSAKAITRMGNSQFLQEQVHQDFFQASRGVTFPYQNSSHKPYVLSIANREQAAQKITITAGSVPRGDSFTLSGSRIARKQLKIDVSYSGGCKPHNFKLYWNGAYQESFPPQVRMRLVHDANRDTCERLVKETLVFDLHSLQPSVIRLTTSFGYSTSIDYIK